MKGKHREPRPERDLYRSRLWRARRQYAEQSGSRWFILSALHGLVDADEPLAPYDLALIDRPAVERRAWGEAVVAALVRRLGSILGITFEIHAGSAYRAALGPPLVREGGLVVAPTAAIPGVGAQIAWYRAARDGASRRQAATDAEVDAALGSLDRKPLLVAARDWPTSLAGLDQPGLYSWWVDETGAAALSRGLGWELALARI